MMMKTTFRVYGYTCTFLYHFTKGNNYCEFLFAYFDTKAVSKWVLLLKEQREAKIELAKLLSLIMYFYTIEKH